MKRRLEDELSALKQRSLHRRLREVTSSQAMELEFGGGRMLNFSSNDYLGLAADPVLCEAAKKAIDEFGVGSGASRLISGTRAPHVELERTLAEFKRTEAAIAFSSGYAAALGTIRALAGRDDVIILDKLAHASLIDGARLSGAIVRVFPHNHLGKLESHLEWAATHHPEARALVITESVFSMDGDRAPLAETVAVVKKFRAMLMLDEAHAVGVLGANGRGLADLAGLAGEVDVQMGTLSKALGASGGYVCGSQTLVDFLVNRARSFIYSTAPPPAVAAAATAALRFLMSDAGEARRKALWRNIELLHAGMPESLRPAEISSAIIPVMLGEERTALAAARLLRERGFFVPAIRYPTVARDAARLRVTLSAKHAPEQIGKLAEALEDLSRAMHKRGSRSHA